MAVSTADLVCPAMACLRVSVLGMPEGQDGPELQVLVAKLVNAFLETRWEWPRRFEQMTPYAFVLTDPNPATTLKINDYTDFKVGSVANTLGSLTSVTVAYSSDNGATWTYTPASGAGGAPAGFDRNVTHVRWTFTGSLVQTAPNNSGSVSFTARIR